MHKLMQILDENAELPFQITKLTTSTWKGEWTLYHRDVLEVIRFYFGMQDFAGHIHVRPVHKVDLNGERVYKDFFSGAFVHDLYSSGKLLPGAILLLVILYSDKTHKDVLGIHEAYPVYLYLGNIPTAVRTKNHNAGIVIGAPLCYCDIHINLC